MESCCHSCDETVDDACALVPQFEHLNYFFGQLLGPEDFRAEHDFFASKLAVMQRWTVGYGVVCGLEVTIERAEDCAPVDEFDRIELVVGAGVAVDCDGRILVVRKPLRRRLRTLVPPRRPRSPISDCDDPSELETLYIALSFATHKHRAVRPMAQDPCAPPGGKEWARTIECTEIVVSTEAPVETCDQCCDACFDAAVVIARLDRCDETTGYLVDMSVRRMLARHTLTTITGSSWQHGASYAPDDADRLLQDGLVVRFSRGVRVASIADGVVDLIVYEGGGGRRDNWNYRTLELAPMAPPNDEDAVTSELWFRYTGNDRLSIGDRIGIVIRCDFLLDECCLAVDGNHIGGAIPWFEPTDAPDDWAEPRVVEPILPGRMPACAPPDRPAIWTSGNGTQGGIFESWFFVGNRDEPYGEKRAQ
jgi:hypothetical protein